MEMIKSGFISIIGRPNVGKSTLLNTLLQKKIAITTHKAQTTRNKIQGILTTTDAQYVFVDTPGVHKVQNELDKYMNKTALQSTKGVDIILFLAPCNEFIGENDKFILNSLKEREVPVFLIITKTDLVSAEILQFKIDEWKRTEFDFAKIIPINTTDLKKISFLLEEIKDTLPATGIKYYPNDQYTDQPERFIVREIIREEILLKTEQEVPHSVAILIDKFEDTKKIIKIIASVIVEKNSQKIIIIGKNGQKIKSVGISARKKMEQMFDKQVYLELFVKIKEKWRRSASLIKQLGYDKDSY